MEQIANAFVVCPVRCQYTLQKTKITFFSCISFHIENRCVINVSLIGPFVQDSGVIIEPIVSCSVPQGEWNRWNIWNKIGRLFSRPTPNRTHSVALSCSTCSACFTHSAERNGTRCRNQGRFCSASVSICIGCIVSDTSDTTDTRPVIAGKC